MFCNFWRGCRNGDSDQSGEQKSSFSIYYRHLTFIFTRDSTKMNTSNTTKMILKLTPIILLYIIAAWRRKEKTKAIKSGSTPLEYLYSRQLYPSLHHPFIHLWIRIHLINAKITRTTAVAMLYHTKSSSHRLIKKLKNLKLSCVTLLLLTEEMSVQSPCT